jgi:ribosome-binding protein aMBF1 (putative translation factor)
VKDDPEMLAMIAEEDVKCEIARIVYDLREEAGLARWKLAKMIGTKASVIQQIEDADTEEPALLMLRRIAQALGKKMEIRIVPQKHVKPKRAADQRHAGTAARV